MLRGGGRGRESPFSLSVRAGPKLLLVLFDSGRQNDVGKIMANNSRRGEGGKAKRETEKKFFCVFLAAEKPESWTEKRRRLIILMREKCGE